MLGVISSQGCGKGEEKNTNESTSKTEAQDQDTSLTPEEIFSATLVQGIVGEEDDPDLEAFLEEDLYGELKNSKAVTMDRISSSMYVIEYENLGQMKSYLIRKYYNPQKDEYYFEKTASDLDVKKHFLKQD
jgi:hypothetical protein